MELIENMDLLAYYLAAGTIFAQTIDFLNRRVKAENRVFSLGEYLLAVFIWPYLILVFIWAYLK